MLKALCIDDDLEVLKIQCELLEEEGIQCESTTSGETAIQILEANENKFDIIFVDMLMPGTTGFQLIPHLRCIDDSTAIISISALYRGTSILNKDGSYDSLPDIATGKPLNIEELRPFLQNHATTKEVQSKMPPKTPVFR